MGKKRKKKSPSPKKKYQKRRPKPQSDIHVGIFKRTEYGAVIDLETTQGFKGRMWVIDQSPQHIQAVGRTIFADVFPSEIWR